MQTYLLIASAFMLWNIIVFAMCGVCIDRCPVQAISFENGMKPALCSGFLNKVSEKHNPRYGCGKCQVSVPCESEIPDIANIK